MHPLAAYTLGFLKRLFTYDSSLLVLCSDAADPPPGTRLCVPPTICHDLLSRPNLILL